MPAMLRSQALSAIFNENLDDTAHAIFLSTSSGHLIGSSTPTANPSSSSGPPSASLIRKSAILGSSTFGYYSEHSSTSNASALSDSAHSDHDLRGPNGHDQRVPRASAGSSESPGIGIAMSGSGSGSVRTSTLAGSGTFGSGSGYLSVQPLPLVARQDWEGEREDSKDGVEGLRRVIVEIQVGKIGSVEDSEGRAKMARRFCAIESIGKGLCVGVLGGEREDVFPVIGTAGRGGVEDGDGEENDDKQEDEHETVGYEHGRDGQDGQSTGQVDGDTEGRRQREIRLLDVRTEALAEFMREEFRGFSMPGTVWL